MNPFPRLLPDSETERFSSDREFLLCVEGLDLTWEEELEDGEEADRERLVQMQLSDPGLEAAVWENELVEVWEAETASSLEVLLRPV